MLLVWLKSDVVCQLGLPISRQHTANACIALETIWCRIALDTFHIDVREVEYHMCMNLAVQAANNSYPWGLHKEVNREGRLLLCRYSKYFV